MSRTRITIDREPQDSQTNSYSEEEESHRDSRDGFPSTESWPEDYDDDELDPDDSASASNSRPTRSRSHHRAPFRRHRLQSRQSRSYRPVPHAPNGNLDHSEEFGPGAYGPRGGYGPPQAGQFYRGGPGPGYPQSTVGGYAPGPFPTNQMVPYNYHNPFTPHANGSGASFFGDPREQHYMPHYQPGPGHFYAHGYNIPPHLQQYHNSYPPPPPTEAPAPPATPAPKETKPSPEMIRMQEELARFKEDQAKKEEAEKRKELEARIRQDAEDQIKRRLEEMRRTQEEAKREIEKAKKEAERAAKDAIEAERRADEERRRLQDEAMKRAEREAREKIEAEQKAAAEAARREEEARKMAEAAARIKLEEAMKAEAEAKAAAAKKAAEEDEFKKKLAEEARLKAENDAREKLAKEAADAKAAAEAAADAAKAADELKKKIQEETKESIENARKKDAKAPIKFKDAVGRKFSFPFHLCQTWSGMEELIKQAFVHVDVIGPEVQLGHFDLIGPDSEIILPQVWDKVVEPDWQITMVMWPVDKPGPRDRIPPEHLPFMMRDRHSRHGPAQAHSGRMGGGPASGVPPIHRRQGGPGGGGMGRPPPPPGMHARGIPMRGPGSDEADIITVEQRERRGAKKSSGGILNWMSGSGAPKKRGSKGKKSSG